MKGSGVSQISGLLLAHVSKELDMLRFNVESHLSHVHTLFGKKEAIISKFFGYIKYLKIRSTHKIVSITK